MREIVFPLKSAAGVQDRGERIACEIPSGVWTLAVGESEPVQGTAVEVSMSPALIGRALVQGGYPFKVRGPVTIYAGIQGPGGARSSSLHCWSIDDDNG